MIEIKITIEDQPERRPHVMDTRLKTDFQGGVTRLETDMCRAIQEAAKKAVASFVCPGKVALVELIPDPNN